MRSLSLSLVIAAVTLSPAVAGPAPATNLPDNTSAQLVQYYQQQQPQGWWEREGRPDELRERYWQLPPPQRFRYNQLEQQIRELEARQEQLRREQRRILRWGS